MNKRKKMEATLTELLICLNIFFITGLLIHILWKGRKTYINSEQIRHQNHQTHEFIIDRALETKRTKEELKAVIEILSKSQEDKLDEILRTIQRIEKNSADLNIRMHVTEARMDERKNITIAQTPTQGSRKGWPKGKPRKVHKNEFIAEQ
jgi:FtsZ-interacting cell division protein ZipA